MTRPRPTHRSRHQPALLAGFMLLQGVAAVFFIADAVEDLLAEPPGLHVLTETLVAAVLVLGIGLVGWQLRLTLEEIRRKEQALDTARGDFLRVVEDQFRTWGLTPAERDVGLMALKGADVAEIAEARSAAHGTVRAQLTRIYAKAGVSGRAQFAAWFVEDLLDIPGDRGLGDGGESRL